MQINRIAFSLGIKNNKDINAELLYIQSDEFLNKYCDFNFQWGSSKTSNGGFNDNESNGLLNTVEDRRIASVKLLSHIKANLGNAEEIVLIGHSHGGNIAIQTADKIFDEMPQIKNVYVLTIGTPAYNLEFIVSLVRNDNLQPISDNIFLSILNKNIYIYSALALNKIDFLTYIKSKGCNFLYLNCENPKLWNKKYIDRIEHIALWNSTDYVDNISKAYDVTFDPYVAMSCVSSHFTNHKTHNVKFKLSKKQIASNYKSSLKPIIEWIAKLDNLNRQLWILRGKYIFNISSFFKLCSYETYYQKTCSKYYHNTQDINAIDALYVQKSISYDKFKINNRDRKSVV